MSITKYKLLQNLPFAKAGDIIIKESTAILFNFKIEGRLITEEYRSFLEGCIHITEWFHQIKEASVPKYDNGAVMDLNWMVVEKGSGLSYYQDGTSCFCFYSIEKGAYISYEVPTVIKEDFNNFNIETNTYLKQLIFDRNLFLTKQEAQNALKVL